MAGIHIHEHPTPILSKKIALHCNATKISNRRKLIRTQLNQPQAPPQEETHQTPTWNPQLIPQKASLFTSKLQKSPMAGVYIHDGPIP